MFHIKNDINNIVCAQAHTKVFRFITAYGGFLKFILINLYNTIYIYIQINVSHLDAQKHVSYKESLKMLLIYYLLCLETVGNVFSIIFNGLFLLC